MKEKQMISPILQTASKIVNWEKHLEIERRHLIAMHTELGRLYGIPECCIKQFCDEVVLGILSAQYRSLKHKKIIPSQIGYVPCDKCMKNI